MAEITAQLQTPWLAGATLWSAALGTPWLAGAEVWSTGGPYTPPPAPPGGTPGVPSTAARITIGAASAYNLTHTIEARDLRDNALIELERVSIAADRDSMFWTLRAMAGAAVYDKLKAGEQPARVRVTVDGQAWDFLIENLTRSRRFPAGDAPIEGRSLAAAAGAPYQPEQLWAVEGDTTAAQIVAAANLYTGLDVRWMIDDWLVPAGVFSLRGTPLGVLRRVADAVGAVVLATRTGFGVTVMPRYAVLPNEWGSLPPDLQLPLELLEVESFTVDKQPAYDGVLVTGQQRGVIAFVRLEGTTGANQAPLVSDELITDLPAAGQRGQAILGRSGAQQIHTLGFPVPQAAGAGVVADPGWLLRLQDTPQPWVGLITGVQIEATLPAVVQTLTVERHVEAVPGTVAAAPPGPVLAFVGPIGNVTVAPGGAVSVALSGNWVNGVAPRRYSLRSGVLPSWLSLNADTGLLAGTAPGAPEELALAVRCTDAIDSTADSNVFTVTVEAPAAPLELVVDLNFSGTNGQTTGVVNAGTLGGTLVCGNSALSTAQAVSAPSSVLLVDDSALGFYLGPFTHGPVPPQAELEFKIRAAFGGLGASGFVGAFFDVLNYGCYFDVSSSGVKLSLGEGTGDDYALNTWHTVRVLLDPVSNKILLYVNTVFVEEFVLSPPPGLLTFESLTGQFLAGAEDVWIDDLRLRLPPE